MPCAPGADTGAGSDPTRSPRSRLPRPRLILGRIARNPCRELQADTGFALSPCRYPGAPGRGRAAGRARPRRRRLPAGGFVGVDVFFVLSGFLITGLLLAEARANGSVSLVDFYVRRARRILPAAALTLLVTDVAAFFLLNFLRASDVVQDSLYAAGVRRELPVRRARHRLLRADAAALAAAALLVARGRGAVLPRLAAAALARAVRRGADAAAPAAPGRGSAATAASSWSCSRRLARLVGAPHHDAPGRGVLLAVHPRLGAGARRRARRRRGDARARAGGRSGSSWAGPGCWRSPSRRSSSPAQTPFPGSAALLPTVGAALVIVAGIGRTPLPTGGRAPARAAADARRRRPLLRVLPLALAGADPRRAVRGRRALALRQARPARGRVPPVVRLLRARREPDPAQDTESHRDRRRLRRLDGRRPRHRGAVARRARPGAAAVRTSGRVGGGRSRSGQPTRPRPWRPVCFQTSSPPSGPPGTARPSPPASPRRSTGSGRSRRPTPCRAAASPATSSGSTSKICRVGRPTSHRLIVLVGDSHARCGCPRCSRWPGATGGSSFRCCGRAACRTRGSPTTGAGMPVVVPLGDAPGQPPQCRRHARRRQHRRTAVGHHPRCRRRRPWRAGSRPSGRSS